MSLQVFIEPDPSIGTMLGPRVWQAQTFGANTINVDGSMLLSVVDDGDFESVLPGRTSSITWDQLEEQGVLFLP